MRIKRQDIRQLEIDIRNQQEKLIGQAKAGAYLKQLRSDLGLSLADLGTKLNVSAAYLSNIEQGVKTMSDIFIRQISEYYDINEDLIYELLGRPLLSAREELEDSPELQQLLAHIRKNKQLSDDKKEELIHKMRRLYVEFISEIETDGRE